MSDAINQQRWADVAVFENPDDARVLATVLSGKGFKARIFNDRMLQMLLFLCPPRATFRVQVRAGELPAAETFLDQEPVMPVCIHQALRCPFCGSLHVKYPQMTRKFFLPTLLVHLGIIFRVIEHQAWCEHCQFLWKLPDPHLRLKPVHQGKNTFL